MSVIPGVSEPVTGADEARSAAAVTVAGLRKTYGTTVAVDEVSFSVGEGEIFGILGPNGAGKTTTVECVIGLRTPDAGTIRVMGLDPRVDRAALHAIVGVQLQSSALPGQLKAGEILDLFHSFYPNPAGASGMGQLILYPSLFFAGLWVPREVMPAVLRDIGDWTPLGAAVQALQSSMQGSFPSAQPLLVMAAYTVSFSFLAVHYFRWE